ncbi:MAG: replication factor C small subunit [Candidatus Hydrothermarchaeales archaeon]
MIEEIWVERYRPDKVEEIVGQKEIVDRLKGYIISRNLPNMLFAGRPGVGKTTAALALTKELFGEKWRGNFLELNASDERGIDVVRGKIKDFARTQAIGGDFKIIFLDEADALTRDAQQALRRTMERFSSTCRFILSCNYSSKIIEPIQSRCALFRFRNLEKEDIKARIEVIAGKEKLEITEDGLDAMLYASEGDLRKAINLLQSSAALNKKIDSKLIFGVTAKARPEEIREVVKTAIEGKFIPARDALRELVITYGMSGEDVVKQLHKEVFNLDDLKDEVKVKLADIIGEYEFRMVEGSNELIQLEALLAQFVLIGKEAEMT